MPIVTAPGGAARLSPVNRALRNDLAAAIAELSFADLWRGQGTIASSGAVRIDMQGVWSGGPGSNIQAQTGGVSLAAVRVANTLQAAAGANQALVVTAIGNALLASVAGVTWQNVTGTAP